MNSSIRPEAASSPARMVAQQSAIQSRSTPTKPEVTALTPSSVEQELDDAIRTLGDRMVQADKDGDPTGRDILAGRMYAAIRSRTPEHQARLQAEAEQRVHDELTFAGDWAHQVERRRIG